MSLLVRILLSLLLILTGFLAANESAEVLEYILVDANWSTWFLSPYLSRILTGSSIALGLMVLVGAGNRRTVYGAVTIFSAGMLLLAILEPTLLELTRCYACLQEFPPLKISRYQGIFVWTCAILLSLYLYKFGLKPRGWQLPQWSAIVVFLLAFPIPFILNYPAHWAIYGEKPEIAIHHDLGLSRLDTVHIAPEFGRVPSDLRSGKKLVCIVSLTCQYCSRLAYKLHIIRKDHPDFPVVMMMTGDESALPSFLKRTRSENVPSFLMNNNLMHDLSQGYYPRVFVVQDGIAVKEMYYWAVSPSTITD